MSTELTRYDHGASDLVRQTEHRHDPPDVEGLLSMAAHLVTALAIRSPHNTH